MQNIKKIMAAICFSDYCQGTFDLAALLAGKFDAHLVVVNVINVRDVEDVSAIESMGYNVHAAQYIEGIEEERVVELEKMIEASGFPSDKVKAVFKVGHPYEELMNVIGEEDVDMVVMGTKGRSNVAHVLVGSVAEKLFRHSPVPVVSNREKLLAKPKLQNKK